MKLQIRYFASLREALGTGEEHVVFAGTTLGALKQELLKTRPALGANNLRAAVNQAMAEANTPLQDGDEIAFFPPVTGG